VDKRERTAQILNGLHPRYADAFWPTWYTPGKDYRWIVRCVGRTESRGIGDRHVSPPFIVDSNRYKASHLVSATPIPPMSTSHSDVLSTSCSDRPPSTSYSDRPPSTPPRDRAQLSARSRSLQSTRPNKGSSSHKESLSCVKCVCKSLRLAIRLPISSTKEGRHRTWSCRRHEGPPAL